MSEGARKPLGPLGALPQLSATTRRALWAAGTLAACHALALIAQAWALAEALAAVVGHSAGPANITGSLGLLVIALIARAGLGWATESVSARAAAGAKAELRGKLLDNALNRGPEWIDRTGRAELSTLATKGLDSLDAYFTKYLPALVTAAVVPLVVAGSILLSDWVSAVLVAVTVPLIPLFAWLVGRFTETRTARATEAIHRLSAHTLELVRALPVLTAFRRAAEQGRLIGKISDDHRRATLSALRIAFLSALVLELLASLSVALVAVGIGFRLVYGDLDLATGLFVLILVPECYLPLRAAGAAHHASEDGLEAVRRVHELDTDDGTRSARAVPSSSSPATDGLTDALSPKAVLRVHDLRVSRRHGNTPDGLDFSVRPGEVLRLDECAGLGPSGSGKSTTFAALLGFVAPASGSISYGDHDVSAIDPSQWRRAVAWVPQRPAFSGGSVVDELTLAVADQPPVSSEDTREALREAAAEHLWQRHIDELSTGERQRVALARAFLRLRGEAGVLLLDEPTAHLDPATAHRVHTAIQRAADHGAIVVLASHRNAPQIQEHVPSPGIAAAGPRSSKTRGRLRDLITARGLFGVTLGALSLLAGLALAATSAWLIARASQQPPVLTLTVAAVGVRAFAITRAVLRYTERLVTHDAAFRLATDLRQRLWNALVHCGPVRAVGLLRDEATQGERTVGKPDQRTKDHARPRGGLARGEGLARLVDDADSVRDLAPRVVGPLLIALVVIVGAVWLQTAVLPAAGLLLAVSLLVAATASPAVAVLVERRATAKVAAGKRHLAAKVFGLIDASAEFLAFGAHASARAELATDDAKLAQRARRAAIGAGAATAVLSVAIGSGVVGGLWLGAAAVSAGRLAPELAPVLALVPLAAAEAVALVAPAVQQGRSLRAAQARLAPLLAESTLASNAETGVTTSAASNESGSQGRGVVLQGVTVRWLGAAEPTLRDVDLRIPRGSHVAVIGPSGSGKSTLLAVLLGFLTPESGTVTTPKRVAWCPQEPQLVSTTVRENLRLAAPAANDERLAEALRLAGLPAWADRLDQRVGADGTQLSGGEAQRLALARALLADDAELVLLDEPTAHVDTETAQELLTRVRGSLGERTLIQVTHHWAGTAERDTTGADMVIRVDQGTISVLHDRRTVAVGGAGTRGSEPRVGAGQ